MAIEMIPSIGGSTKDRGFAPESEVLNA
jgi:hypothetical protein